MNKAIFGLTIALMGAALVATFPLYLWAEYVQKRLGNTRAAFAVYMAGIVLPTVLFYVMMSK